MIRFTVPLLLALSACAPVPSPDVADRRDIRIAPLPPMKTFALRPQRTVARSNIDIANDFLDLAFQMESGRPLPGMTRYEQPIRVRLSANAPAAMERDLDHLLRRLRREAGIDIRRAANDEAANLRIEAVRYRLIRRYAPQAACFVVPRVGGWMDLRRSHRTPKTDWSSLPERNLVTVFIPSDVSPQEARDCLHEEVAQAIGPLNDLYRLPDSVFNDDNLHTVLTGFDMLILRAYYAPEMRNGMTRAEAEATLPLVLARLNPNGEAIPPQRPARSGRPWIAAIETALGPDAGPRRKVRAARTALRIAFDERWNDTRTAFSLFTLARLSMATRPGHAVEAYVTAGNLYRALPGHDVQAAHVGLQIAALALSADQPEHVIRIADRHMNAAIRSENAALLALLMLLKAEALERLDRTEEARTLRLDSLGWARYGFGQDAIIRARLAEIATLAPARDG